VPDLFILADSFMKIPQAKCTTMQKRIQLYTVLIVSGLCSNLYADETDDAFRFELTPYLWAATIKGTIATGGEE
jgi:hypothetical protein